MADKGTSQDDKAHDKTTLDSYRTCLDQICTDIQETESRMAKLRQELNDELYDLDMMREAAKLIGHLISGDTVDDGSRPTHNQVWSRVGRHIDIAERVMRTTGHPMRFQEIIEAMRKAEHKVGVDHNGWNSSLYRALNENKNTFKKIERGVWSLVEWSDSSHNKLTNAKLGKPQQIEPQNLE